jgi:prophage antirepressor-like protein
MSVHPTLLLHPSLENAQLAFFYEETEKQFYFRGVDAAKSLGYANPSRSLRQLVDENWIVMKDDGTAKGNKVLYLAEAGFYQLCFSSKLPQAQVFQKWVFDDVLRSIRENGWYLSPDATSEQVKALIEKFNYLNQKHRREIYPLFKEVAELNAPKVKPVGRHRTNGERNADFLAQREIYFECWDAWENSPSRSTVRVTLEEADQFLPASLKRPWRDE